MGTDSDYQCKRHSGYATKFKKRMDVAVMRCDDGVLSARDRKNHGKDPTFQGSQRGLGKQGRHLGEIDGCENMVLGSSISKSYPVCIEV